MNIALMNSVITFQQNVAETDSIGNHIDAWTDYFTCHATVSGESGGESSPAGATVDNAEIDFTTRWYSILSVVEPTGFRILFGEDIFNIVSVDHMNYKRKSLKFRCEKVRR